MINKKENQLGNEERERYETIINSLREQNEKLTRVIRNHSQTITHHKDVIGKFIISFYILIKESEITLKHQEEIKKMQTRVWEIEEILKRKNGEIQHLQTLLSQKNEQPSSNTKLDILNSNINQKYSHLFENFQNAKSQLELKEIENINLKGDLESMKIQISEFQNDINLRQIKIQELESKKIFWIKLFFN